MSPLNVKTTKMTGFKIAPGIIGGRGFGSVKGVDGANEGADGRPDGGLDGGARGRGGEGGTGGAGGDLGGGGLGGGASGGGNGGPTMAGAVTVVSELMSSLRDVARVVVSED